MPRPPKVPRVGPFSCLNCKSPEWTIIRTCTFQDGSIGLLYHRKNPNNARRIQIKSQKCTRSPAHRNENGDLIIDKCEFPDDVPEERTLILGLSRRGDDVLVVKCPDCGSDRHLVRPIDIAEQIVAFGEARKRELAKISAPKHKLDIEEMVSA